MKQYNLSPFLIVRAFSAEAYNNNTTPTFSILYIQFIHLIRARLNMTEAIKSGFSRRIKEQLKDLASAELSVSRAI
jgi:hypothetical protein